MLGGLACIGWTCVHGHNCVSGPNGFSQVDVEGKGAESPACLSICLGMPTCPCAPQELPGQSGDSRGAGTGGRRWPQRLSQFGDFYVTQSQGYHAIVQHAAAVLPAEQGALWRDVGEARLHKGP